MNNRFLVEKYSPQHIEFLNRERKKSIYIKMVRIGILVILLAFWEVAARLNIIDSFIMSSPSRVGNTFIYLSSVGQLWNNVLITVIETVVGFILGTVLGTLFAIIIWWSDFIFKVSEPYLVILNALPKVALGPIIIVWLGAGMWSIIIMALLISVIVSTINILSGFKNVNENKISLMKSFGATKFQILTKLVFPSNLGIIISTLKINVGMSLIGVITGEFLVASQGIGYLIVYGGQVFKMDLVMAGVFALLVIAGLIYIAVAQIEKVYINHKR